MDLITDYVQNTSKKESDETQTSDFKIEILHIRPEVCGDVEFLLTYNAREKRGEKYVEEIFTKAFKTAHPTWIIKKVTVKAEQ